MPRFRYLHQSRDTYGEVQQAVGDHLKVIRPNITDLLRMERTLAETAARGEGGTAPIVQLSILSGIRIAAQKGRIEPCSKRPSAHVAGLEAD